MHRVQSGRVPPAMVVTAVRAGLSVVVAVLVAMSFARPVSVTVLVALSSVALVLDWVDGQVARRTRTDSAAGARFDMETDAFLIAVLSVYVARDAGAWVLLIGAMRYLLWLAERAVPWLRRPVPPRYWRKVVAAVQGVVLTVAASGLLPDTWAGAALLVALVLLLESFGRDVWWLWRTRRPAQRGLAYPAGGGATLVAGLAVWVALVLPDGATGVTGLSPSAFIRLPVEGLLLLGLTLALGPRSRRVAAVGFGLVLGVLLVVKVLDLGFLAVLDRPFDPVADWTYLGPGVGVLGDSIGRGGALAAAVGAGVTVLAVLVVLPLATVRLADAAAARRRTSTRAVLVLGAAWLMCAAAGLQFAPAARVASGSTASMAYGEVLRVHDNLADRRTFAREIAADRFATASGDRLLRGLRGKDVVVAFVESYGRVAVEGTSYSPGIDAVLDSGTRRLRAAGYAVRSGFLTSPTFGAASWLAHATLQSGLWTDSQRRYDQLIGQQRLTLTSAFERAGWRTVFDVPANTRDWPEGADFYGFDRLYDSRDVGYRGPQFGYAPMPDQYTLDALRRLELSGPHAPVMAEVDLVSSHHPWAPLPRPVPWRQVGDGSVFDGMPEQGESSAEVLADPERVRSAYGRSIEYTMRTLVSFLTTYPDRDLVLVVLGDHQPHSYVTGPHPGHDVPVSVIAQDPTVLRRIAGWGWQPGLHPGPNAPVWRMDAFRDRFLSAFSRPAAGPGGRPPSAPRPRRSARR